MALTKTATPQAALPYARPLLTKWKNLGLKAAHSRCALPRELVDQPGTWEALAATLDSGVFPPEALWNLNELIADHIPPRHLVAVLRSVPGAYTSVLRAWAHVSVALARALRHDPTVLDGLEGNHETLQHLRAIARAEAQGSEFAPAATRARLAAEWTANNTPFPGLCVIDGVVTRVSPPGGDRQPHVTATATRAFGPTFVQDVAAALRARLAEHTAVEGQPNTYPLFPSAEALHFAAPALRPEEVCGFQVNFPVLADISAAWSLDDLVRAAEATRDRNRPGSTLLVNSLAVLCIARDPTSAPRVEHLLHLHDLSNLASPRTTDVLAALRRTSAAWQRHFALDLVFVPEAPWSVFRAPIALALLADTDLEAARDIAAEVRDTLDLMRLGSPEAERLEALLALSPSPDRPPTG